MSGNVIPDSYLRKLYGKDHWINAPREQDDRDAVPEAVERFLREQL